MGKLINALHKSGSLTMKNRIIKAVFFLILLIPTVMLAATKKDEVNWDYVLKKQYFRGQTIIESNDIIDIEAPYRAEDPALVPIKIISKIKQTEYDYIKKIIVLVDNNPLPFVGEFRFTPLSGKADLAMRIRINTYSHIRAIAEMSNGKLYMVKKFVKASGGCSAPIGADLDAAMKRLGKMKFKLDPQPQKGEPIQTQLLMSHPNITGMQMDQVTRFIKQSHFINQFSVTFNNKPVLKAKVDIAISADPNFRFYFIKDKPGTLTAEFTDISCESAVRRDVCTKGQRYTISTDIK